MGTTDLFVPDFPHGTAEGFDDGCRGGACPAAAEHGLSCKRAKTLSRSDIRYNRLVKDGRTPAEIAAIIDGHEIETPTITAAAPVTVEIVPDGPSPLAALAPVAFATHVDGTETAAVDVAAPESAFEEFDSIQHAAARDELVSTPEGRAKVREWARQNGFVVGVKGKLPGGVVAAYLREHLTPAPTSAPLPAAEFASALEDVRDRVDAPQPEQPQAEEAERFVDPEIGVRAWVRYDDGVGVVREVERDDEGIATFVRVTFLPDPRDEDAWDTLDWLDDVTDLRPVAAFSYDRFGTDDIHAALAEWENEGRVWQTETERRANDETGLDALRERLNRSEQRVARPDWADITVSQDVEAARATAVRLEQELALAEADRDQARAALELTLRAWDRASTLAASMSAALEKVVETHVASLNTLNDTDARLADAIDANAILVDKLAAAETELERLRGSSLPLDAETWRKIQAAAPANLTIVAQHAQRPAGALRRLFTRR